jgi:hypothetical protein
VSKVRAVAATIVFMLGVSVSYAQGPPLTFPLNQQTTNVPPDRATAVNSYNRLDSSGAGPGYPTANGQLYVACWAEVPSHNTAYFSATFAAPTVNSARKEFRELVTTQYGAVGKLQCAGKFNEAVVNEQVEKWKDSARSKNAIVDTDWQPVASLRGTTPDAQAKN